MSGTSLVTGGVISNVGVTAGADWGDAEKEQIRSALGIVGTKTPIVDSEILDAVDALPTVSGIADAVWDEDLTTHTTSKSAGWFVRKIKQIVDSILGLIA